MFFKCLTEKDCNDLYRKLAKRLHPDLGGDNALMMLLTEAYEDKLKELDVANKKPKYEKTTEQVFDNDPRFNILVEILFYASDHPNFDANFINSVDDYACEHGYLTARQYNCLVNIYYRYKMHQQ